MPFVSVVISNIYKSNFEVFMKHGTRMSHSNSNIPGDFGTRELDAVVVVVVVVDVVVVVVVVVVCAHLWVTLTETKNSGRVL